VLLKFRCQCTKSQIESVENVFSLPKFSPPYRLMRRDLRQKIPPNYRFSKGNGTFSAVSDCDAISAVRGL